jgi:hypothetical protein
MQECQAGGLARNGSLPTTIRASLAQFDRVATAAGITLPQRVLDVLRDQHQPIAHRFGPWTVARDRLLAAPDQGDSPK